MKQIYLSINGIPSILWGNSSEKLFVAVHGKMSKKDDAVILILAEEAVKRGYGVLSFDLPEHGDRRNGPDKCNARNCVRDLNKIMDYAAVVSGDISLFACSMGAYFSLIAYKDIPLKKALFLSPVTDMVKLVEKTMPSGGLSKEELEDYNYIKANPITKWSVPTTIISGSEDNICNKDDLSAFVNRYSCRLEVVNGAEHYFHTKEQLNKFRNLTAGSLDKKIKTIKAGEDITLKQLEHSDAPRIFGTINSEREYLGKWLPFVEYSNELSDTEKYIKSVYSGPEENREEVFVIIYRNSFAGLIGFLNTEKPNKKTEIGYWLSKKYTGKGIMTKSVNALINYAFGSCGINKVQIKCAVGNIRSGNVAKRLGFKFEGIERDGELLQGGKFTDSEVYGLLKKEYRK
ncbi:MAG: GNAT family N-acetyltransferase [Bacteroidales bacterium]|jgi:RimJ/RimL family protein N-acetyltransferase/alpha-beta hydrolase superfamily lysophospholipase|nr:GNAT family N-acetyltransferase [Bacteroidales bacterium]